MHIEETNTKRIVVPVKEALDAIMEKCKREKEMDGYEFDGFDFRVGEFIFKLKKVQSVPAKVTP